MKPVLKMLAIGMASYESWYEAHKDDPIRQLLQSLWKGSKYWQVRYIYMPWRHFLFPLSLSLM